MTNPDPRARDLREPGGFLRRFLRARHGGIALNFALIALPLAVLSLGLIDVNRASMSKRNLQDALDAAALIVAKSDADTDAEADTIGDAALAAQLSSSDSDNGALVSATFTLSGNNDNTVVADASMSVAPVVANLWLQGNMSIGAHSEVLRSAVNLEVALVLDITYSMVGTPLADLKTAAGELVDLVISDVQTPYYSKVALVPYSMGVNLDSQAATARGAIPAAKTISGASWASGSAKTITGITKANPAVVTAANHGFANGDRVYISGVKGMTQVNGNVYTVANKQTNTFQLQNTNSSSWNSFQTGNTPRATECQATDCEVVVTANGHGFANDAWVRITGVGGMTDLNNRTWQVKNQTANTFWLDNSFGPDYDAFSSNGSAWCTTYGCQYYRYTGRNGSTYVQEISTCVSERTGANKQTDVSLATSPVGLNYAASGSNSCLTATMTGLSSAKATLKTKINAYVAHGSTAGQIGLEWGWFAVSPNFTNIFGGTSAPAAYSAPETKKVVILMTDGEFNTTYCNGVLSNQTSVGVSSYDGHAINCAATNGDGFTQAKAMCAAMKLKGIVIYTVGFNISSSADVTDMLNSCATSGSAYLPNSGTALKTAFKAIGQDIQSLRISR
ncbi:MAG TPA: ubiquitin-activating E1 FCCH domain-containing protein [Caulobacter sp.]|nr:ubiquitin-activating E1 FCCH domain-containing protein [Caulobacter sp.]